MDDFLCANLEVTHDGWGGYIFGVAIGIAISNNQKPAILTKLRVSFFPSDFEIT